MNREVLRGAIIIVLLLSLGALIGESFKPLSSSKLESNPFRAWFWEQRTFDLLAQVGLIFAGALGVAAILPQASPQSFPEEGKMSTNTAGSDG